MMKMLVLLVGLFLLPFANGNGIEQGQSLVASNASCESLSESQLESIGDYYMEQMHPGRAHEFMDEMMGGEGSETLKRMHISIAKRVYCKEDVYVGYGIAMPGNMMNGNWQRTPYAYGMMGGSNYPSVFGLDFIDVLLYILLIGLIALVYLHIWKKLKRNK